MSSSSYVLAGARTPIGRFLGGLSSFPATELGSLAIGEALNRSELTASDVNEVIMGNILSAGLGQAPARQAAMGAGIPASVGALTINKMCGSGLKAVMLADQVIRAGDANVIVAGGMECMSRAPHLMTGQREGWKFGHQQVLDHMIHDGLWCPFEDSAMGDEADYIAESRSVSREDQDQFALESQRRAVDAAESGVFDCEITPVTVKSRKGETVIHRDEGPRANTTLEQLAGLRPAFSKDGTVTAGNASQLSDGAAAVVVADQSTAAKSSSPFKVRIVASATSGVEPKEIFIAPVSAIEMVLEKAQMSLTDIDLIELNEAFAAQCIACMRPLEMDPAKVNVHGGGIALGHPIGASGARVLVTLMYALEARDLKRGLVSLCLGGGNAVAMIVERD
ncbi:MAG: acetyl-CoA C-acetyltransferase [Pirellulales bacterium]|nr:acetyl-CoA C-acetyltransferase [Pirellulales bacterium]